MVCLTPEGSWPWSSSTTIVSVLDSSRLTSSAVVVTNTRKFILSPWGATLTNYICHVEIGTTSIAHLLFILCTPHRAWNMCYGSFLRGNHVGWKRPINTHGSHWLSVPTICTGHIIRADPKLAHYIRIHFTFGFHLFEGSIDHHFLGLCLFFHGHSSFHQVILFVFEGLRSFVVSYNLSEDLISVILILPLYTLHSFLSFLSLYVFGLFHDSAVSPLLTKGLLDRDLLHLNFMFNTKFSLFLLVSVFFHYIFPILGLVLLLFSSLPHLNFLLYFKFSKSIICQFLLV